MDMVGMHIAALESNFREHMAIIKSAMGAYQKELSFLQYEIDRLKNRNNQSE